MKLAYQSVREIEISEEHVESTVEEFLAGGCIVHVSWVAAP
jgi:hypothetical protein